MPQPEGFNPPVREGGRLSRSPNWRTLMTGFSPRSHEGSDWNGTQKTFRNSGFNPRSHEGSDLQSVIGLLLRSSFNPRSHEGSDQMQLQKLFSLLCFNPRSHEGSDESVVAVSPESKLFQSTLPRGERLKSSSTYCR